MKIFTTKDGLEYEVHRSGEVWSLPKDCTGATSCCGKRKKRLLKVQVTNSGYGAVNLGSKNRMVSIHRLVAKMFCNMPEDGCVVNHIDGNKLNNSAENLEWVTRSENMIHSYTKLHQKNYLKTTDKDREAIISLFNSGVSMKDIAISHYTDISLSTIRRIISGAEYKIKTQSSVYLNNNKSRKSGSERIPEDIKLKAIEMTKNGSSVKEVSENLGISKYTIWCLLGWKRSKK